MARKSENFAQIITDWRQRHGISQAQMARDAGVARETLAQMERGAKKPHARTEQAVREYMKRISDTRKTEVLAPDHDAAPGGVVTSVHPYYALVRSLCELGQVVLVDGHSVAIYQIKKTK